MKSLIFKRSLRKSDTMKLSICIPVYNFDVRGLVFDLKREIENHRMNAEIILIDDASKESFNTLNCSWIVTERLYRMILCKNIFSL